jgi:hypothetical protein
METKLRSHYSRATSRDEENFSETTYEKLKHQRRGRKPRKTGDFRDQNHKFGLRNQRFERFIEQKERKN